MSSIRHGRRTSNGFALTFDDGPGPHTARLLDELAAHDAKATFFVVGSRIAGREELIARIAAEGHDLGSHSWSHERAPQPGAAFADDLARTSTAIERAAGIVPLWFRPPYADFTPDTVRAARRAGMDTVTWDTDPRDWEADDAGTVAERVVYSALPGSIVLLHEGELAVQALPSILDGLHAIGLVPVTVSALLATD